MRVLYSISMSLFLQSDKWGGKFSRQKHALWKLSHCYPPQWCQNWTEQHEETLNQKAGGLGCHRMVTFCVERHYDNECSFSITSTSWAPFPLMYFTEGNGLWQSYLLHCIAGLFLEITWKKKICFREYLWKSISKQLSTIYYWVLWEINSVLKVIPSTCVPCLGLFVGSEYAWLLSDWLSNDESWKLKAQKNDAIVRDTLKMSWTACLNLAWNKVFILWLHISSYIEWLGHHCTLTTL